MTSIDPIPYASLASAVQSMRISSRSFLPTSSSSLSDGFDCPSLTSSSSTSSDILTDTQSPPQSPLLDQRFIADNTYELGSYTDIDTPRPTILRCMSYVSPGKDNYDASDAGYEAECEDYPGNAKTQTRPKVPRRESVRRRGNPKATLTRIRRGNVTPPPISTKITPPLPSSECKVSDALPISSVPQTPHKGPANVDPSTPPVFAIKPHVAKRPIGLGIGLPSTHPLRAPRPTIKVSVDANEGPPVLELAPSEFPFASNLKADSVQNGQITVVHPTVLPDLLSPMDALPSPIFPHNSDTRGEWRAGSFNVRPGISKSRPSTVGAFLTRANLAEHNKRRNNTLQAGRCRIREGKLLGLGFLVMDHRIDRRPSHAYMNPSPPALHSVQHVSSPWSSPSDLYKEGKKELTILQGYNPYFPAHNVV